MAKGPSTNCTQSLYFSCVCICLCVCVSLLFSTSLRVSLLALVLMLRIPSSRRLAVEMPNCQVLLALLSGCTSFGDSFEWENIGYLPLSIHSLSHSSVADEYIEGVMYCVLSIVFVFEWYCFISSLKTHSESKRERESRGSPFIE